MTIQRKPSLNKLGAVPNNKADSIFTKSKIASSSAKKVSQSTTAGLLARIAELEQKLVDQGQRLAEQETIIDRISQIEKSLTQQQSSQIAATNNGAASSTKTVAFQTSRRKLLKGLGFAAAGLAASATALTSQGNQEAKAASGDFAILGNSNLAGEATYFSQTGSEPSKGAILWGDWNPSGQSQDPNTAMNPPVGGSIAAGLAGTSSTGIGGYFQGSSAPILLKPSSTSSYPSSGTHYQGELYIDNNGDLYICKVGTNPGPISWAKVNTGSGTGGAVSSVGVTSPITNTGTSTAPVIGLGVTAANNGGAVALQSTTPGTQQSGNINVSGAIIVGGAITATSKFLLSSVPILESGTSFPTSPTPVDGQRFRHMTYRSWFTYNSTDAKWRQDAPGVFNSGTGFPNVSVGDNTAAPNIQVRRLDYNDGIYTWNGTKWIPSGTLVVLSAPARIIDDTTARAAGYSTNITVVGVNTFSGGTLLPSKLTAVWAKVTVINGTTNGTVAILVENPDSTTNAVAVAGNMPVNNTQVTGLTMTALSSTGQLKFTVASTGIGIARFVIDIMGYVI